MTITVVDSDVEADIPVATPAALVAMKLHAIQDRTQDRKRSSDAWNLYRLLHDHNAAGEVAAALNLGPLGLRGLVAGALDRVFRSDVTRTRRYIHGYGEPAWVDVMTDDALGQLATELVEGLAPNDQ
jgi:hypothetical protein